MSGLNAGHGYVTPRAFKAKCGGPALCADCTEELRALHRCPSCLDDGHVCEEHPEFPFGVALKGHSGRDCGIGMPCPACCSPVPQDGKHPITEAFTPDWLRAPASPASS